MSSYSIKLHHIYTDFIFVKHFHESLVKFTSNADLFMLSELECYFHWEEFVFEFGVYLCEAT